MGNIDTSKSNVSRYFLLWWVLVNIVGLPVLFLPYNIGFYLTLGLAIVADGGSVGPIWYVFIAIILALCGAILGGWLGFMQWLVLRTRIQRSGQWIWASILGIAIGAPLSWLAYELIFYSPIVNRPDGIYFSYWYEYIAFGVILGLTVGVSQWNVLKQQANRVGLWILTLPVCFTLGMALTNPFYMPKIYRKMFQPLAEIIATLFPNELINYDLIIVTLVDSFMALIGIGIITGFLLDWSLRFQKMHVTG